jgi:hypothetical protein
MAWTGRISADSPPRCIQKRSLSQAVDGTDRSLLSGALHPHVRNIQAKLLLRSGSVCIGLLYAESICGVMIEPVVAASHFCADIQTRPSVLFLKVENRSVFLVGLEPDLALLATSTRTLTEVTEYLHNREDYTTPPRLKIDRDQEIMNDNAN